ncbi:DUF4870 family protein [Ottowia testudinis]|uniref:Transmembrane protein n=1 Tax=Ottowia testudinis TaxID=2816950 RepID=A0A975CGM4_9BURK|nr:hypothetical protein [Ottowia testudinis]QTD46088.1 hypothetical protein J1M35_04030 [Ottowia testudinis]
MSNNDIIDVETIKSDAAARADSLKTWGWVSYILHLIVAVAAVVPGAQVSIALLIIALVMDLVKKDDAAGTWQESHFKWRINSVLWAGVLYVVTFPLFLLLYLPGAIAWAIISIWFLYRIVKGMVRMNAGRAIDG